jgi:hypothetical protein
MALRPGRRLRSLRRRVRDRTDWDFTKLARFDSDIESLQPTEQRFFAIDRLQDGSFSVTYTAIDGIDAPIFGQLLASLVVNFAEKSGLDHVEIWRAMFSANEPRIDWSTLRFEWRDEDGNEPPA